VSTTLFYICISAKLQAQSKLTKSLADKIVIESNLYPGFDRGVAPRVRLGLFRGCPIPNFMNRDSLPSFAVSFFRNLDLQL
jgi:hypothetical protein